VQDGERRRGGDGARSSLSQEEHCTVFATTAGHAGMLFMFTPAGFEGFLATVGQRARPGEPAPPLGDEEIARTRELAPRFGMDVRFPEPTPPGPE
jgi:hypothetical protein